jgi:hypothetical protein
MEIRKFLEYLRKKSRVRIISQLYGPSLVVLFWEVLQNVGGEISLEEVGRGGWCLVSIPFLSACASVPKLLTHAPHHHPIDP